MGGEPNGSHGKNITSNIISTTPIPTRILESTTPDPKEYYKTYDVMTGVRIAATLGSFFGLMVLLVLYKSKSKTEKVSTMFFVIIFEKLGQILKKNVHIC